VASFHAATFFQKSFDPIIPARHGDLAGRLRSFERQDQRQNQLQGRRQNPKLAAAKATLQRAPQQMIALEEQSKKKFGSWAFTAISLASILLHTGEGHHPLCQSKHAPRS
jgi:hypothetical protein